MSNDATLIEVDESHALDREALSEVLSAKMGLSPITSLKLFQGGQSNPTYLLEAGGKSLVLRKKPPGVLLPRAHMVEREYRVMAALAKTDVPVPRVHFLCEDPDILGTAFYVMDFVDGRIIKNPAAPSLSGNERHALFLAMSKTLGALHGLDPDALGLSDFGKKGAYAARQIKTWTRHYQATATEKLQAMDFLCAWLPDNIPDSDETTLVHGDFRLDNLVMHPTQSRVVATLDWELSTLGHPKSDLAYSCLPYYLPAAHPIFNGLLGLDLAALGIPSVEDYLASYCELTGRASVDDLPFYLTLSLFRLAAIVQGVYARSLQGNATAKNAAAVGATTKTLAEIGQRIVQERA